MPSGDDDAPEQRKDALPSTAGMPKPAPVDADAALSALLLTEHEGDASKLLDAVFDFLRRRTNFFKQDHARERAAAACERAAAAAASAPAGDLTAEQVAGAGAAGVAATATAAAAASAGAAAGGEKKQEEQAKEGKEQAEDEAAGPSGCDGDGAEASTAGLLSE
jgi:hypothetical protein